MGASLVKRAKLMAACNNCRLLLALLLPLLALGFTPASILATPVTAARSRSLPAMAVQRATVSRANTRAVTAKQQGGWNAVRRVLRFARRCDDESFTPHRTTP